MSTESVTTIKRLAAEAGYASCGVTSTEPFREFENALRDRMRWFPEAAHLYAALSEKLDHPTSAPWARSIIVCVRRYGKYAIPNGLDAYFGRYYLFDRRIKPCPDYRIAGRFEAALNQLGLRVQRGGVPYRWAGARAGITRFGKNCFAYSEHGSWIDFDAWLVDVNLPADTPTLESVCPEDCRVCIDACPTGALAGPFVMRRDLCIAHLTYEAPTPIASHLWERMGSWIYGCDVCQRACPMNRGMWEPLESAEWLEEIADDLSPSALSAMDLQTYRTKVQPYFWYISVDNLARWHANAVRALRHSADQTAP